MFKRLYDKKKKFCALNIVEVLKCRPISSKTRSLEIMDLNFVVSAAFNNHNTVIN